MSRNIDQRLEGVRFEETSVDCAGTHHVRDGQPIYAARFRKVLKFHPPGLAAVTDASGSYHITMDGSAAYPGRFADVFGFYEGLAAVRDANGYFHITITGQPAYRERYAWCGNYQDGHVPVRDCAGLYFHLDREGHRTYTDSYLYAGDYRDGVACVRRTDGLCIHIDRAGRQVHPTACCDLDVFHKGYARARDDRGWFHLCMDGKPAYEARFADVEPFYNGHAYCRDWSGRKLIVNERGEVAHVVWARTRSNSIGSDGSAGRIIVVVGNCGAGKTTLAQTLGERLRAPVLGIDDFRRSASDGSAVGELRAWEQLLDAVKKCSVSGAVVECSGSGHMAHLVKLTLEEIGNYVVFWLRASPAVCQLRTRCRPADVPYPHFGVPIERLIPELHTRLEREFAQAATWPPERVRIIDGEASPPAVLAGALASLGGGA